MSWAIGYDTTWKRDIGYEVPAYCDHPDCNAKIDRGLWHICGDDPYGGSHGCGLYFCENHHQGSHRTCARCQVGLDPFAPKPDCPEWVVHKLRHPSWKQWRSENKDEVQKLLLLVEAAEKLISP